MELLRAVSIGDLRDSDLPLDAGHQFGAAGTASDDDVALLVAVLYDEDRDLDELPEGVDVAVDARWRLDAYLAAALHAGRYRRLLADPDAKVAALAAELLAWFPPDDAALRALVNIPADGPHALVRASANLTLAFMNRDDSSIDSRLRDQLTSELPGVRLTAAIAMALRSRDLPDAAIDVLTEPVGAAPMAAVPGWSRPLEGFVALALRHAREAPA